MIFAYLLSPLFRRAFELSGLVVFGVKQVNVVRGVTDQHFLSIFTVTQRGDAAGFGGQVRWDETHTHTSRPSAHVVTLEKRKKQKGQQDETFRGTVNSENVKST